MDVGQVKGVLGELNTTSLVALHEEGIVVAFEKYARQFTSPQIVAIVVSVALFEQLSKFLLSPNIPPLSDLFFGASGGAHTDGLPDEVVGGVLEVGGHFCCIWR